MIYLFLVCILTIEKVGVLSYSNIQPLWHLIPPIIVWSPAEQFSKFKEKMTCPKCFKEEKLDKCVG